MKPILLLFLLGISTPAEAVIIFASDGTPLYSTNGALNVYLSNALPLPVTVSSLPAPKNPTGVIQNQTVTGTASTFTAPANAVGFTIESDSSNTDNVRWAVGSVATASVGTLMEPGRSFEVVPLTANISVIALTGSATVSVQWFLSQ